MILFAMRLHNHLKEYLLTVGPFYGFHVCHLKDIMMPKVSLKIMTFKFWDSINGGNTVPYMEYG